MKERIVVAGSGAIACGLAVTVAQHLGEVTMLARSAAASDRARATSGKLVERLELDPESVRVCNDDSVVEDATLVVEAIIEDHDAKCRRLEELGSRVNGGAILATTTSSLSVTELAKATGRPDRFGGLHVFNPVHRMELVELVFPAEAQPAVKQRLKQLCTDLGKTAVEVPDTPGFVVNRLLFPFLFDAVRVLEETGLEPAAVDQCMRLGAGHPMGPLALLDFVGLDVAIAIGDQIRTDIPQRVREMAAEGALGKKAGRGFHTY